MLFPQLGPQYFDERHKGLLSRYEAFYAESITVMQSFWGEADTDTRYEAGDQTLWNDVYGNLPANRRRQFYFNRIKRVVNMIDGHQRNNRKSTIVIPVENAHQATADQMTKILSWINNTEGTYDTISTAFRGSLVTGLNWIQLWVDYRNDPINGNIKTDVVSYNSIICDPFWRKPDLSDCNGIIKRNYLTKRELLTLFPDYKDVIMGLYGQDNRDGKFQFMPENYNFGLKNLLVYDEFYYRDFRDQKLLVDTRTGETFEWQNEDKDTLREFMQMFPDITLIETQVPTVRMAAIVQGKVLMDGPNPLGLDTYPLVPVLSYYTPQMPYFPWRIQGVVRGLRDAQFLYNRRKIIELDILESQINSGWIYKEDALVNPKDVFLSGQGRGLALKQEAQMSDVQQIQAPGIPPSVIELSRSLGQEIQEISGVNEELLGSATDDKAGILSMLRQGAGLTTLQILFDQLDFSQKLVGKLMIQLIQSNFTPGKVQKIVGEQPAAEFYNKLFGRYDSAVEEGMNTTTQKQMQFAQLLHLRGAGIPIPDETIIEAATIQDKNKLIENMQQAKQQQMQIQQQQMEAQLANLSAQTKLAEARTVADEGLGIERLSRVDENKALAEERRAAAIKDEDMALLNLFKAYKELQSIDKSHDRMDIEEISKLANLAHVIKLREISSVSAQQESIVPLGSTEQNGQ